MSDGDDNVIFANFAKRRRVASAEEAELDYEAPPVAPPVAPVAPGSPAAPAAVSPAGMRVLNAAIRRTDVGRVKRGSQYAREGRVVDLRVRANGMEAMVTGSQNDPFYTGFRLPARTKGDLQKALSSIASVPGAAQRVERGELPDSVLDVLLAPSPDEFKFFCDCPDGADVCKHAVALAHVAAERIAVDPLLLFSMRSLSMSMVEDTVRQGAQSLARENADPGSPYFWKGRELPALPAPKVAPMIDDSDTDLLRRALESVSFTNIDLLRAVADIEDLYDAMVDEE